MQIIVRKSCPYSQDQLIEAANGGCTDRFKIKTRGTMKTVGPLRLQVNVPWAKDKLANRDLSWMNDDVKENQTGPDPGGGHRAGADTSAA